MKAIKLFVIAVLLASAVIALTKSAESKTEQIPDIVNHFAFTGSSQKLREGSNWLKILAGDIKRGGYAGMSVTIIGSDKPGQARLTIHVW